VKNDYATQDNEYCYPETSVLINKLDIHNRVLLEKKEHEIVSLRMSQLKKNPLYNSIDFSVQYIKRIHFFLFQDIYSWAGKYRTVRISKNDFMFAYPEYIDQELNKEFEKLKNNSYFNNLSQTLFCEEITRFKIEINTIHPFREGNGRVLRLLVEDIAFNAGYHVQFNQVTKRDYINAMILSPTDERPLKELITFITKPI
jgi:cell filamentation protein